MAIPTNNRPNTISAALCSIDPQGTYVPMTVEYDWVKGSLLSWINDKEPDEGISKSESARPMPRQEAKQLPAPPRRSAPRISHPTSNLDLSFAGA